LSNVPSSLTQIYLADVVKQAVLFPTALTDQECIDLTT
jgi:hypothetical protein